MSAAVLNSSAIFPSYNQVIPFNLTRLQQKQLEGISEVEASCLIDSWNFLQEYPIQGPYCNANWDGINCWPATKAGEIVRLSCSEVAVNEYGMDAQNFSGNFILDKISSFANYSAKDVVTREVHRLCSIDAEWLWDSWNSYNQCGLQMEYFSEVQVDGTVNMMFKNLVCYILFLGSIFSLLCLCLALFLFYYFGSIRCDRITVQIHLLLSLALRCVLLIIISEPCIFPREFFHYRSVDWICKVVLALQLYATVASVNWMFVQGHYLNSRLTTNVFYHDLPFKSYCGFGWGAPALIVSLWASMTEIYHPYPCWKNYGALKLNWIIVGPMFLVLFANLIYLVHIVRIYLRKNQITSDGTQSVSKPKISLNKCRRAMKAAVSLIPLLGLNFLFFAYNPGGAAEPYYMLTNAVSQTTQGVFVSIIYCFFSKDVRNAIRHQHRRNSAHRSTDRVISPCKLVDLDVIYFMVNVGKLPERRNQLEELKVPRASSPMPLMLTRKINLPEQLP